MECQIFATRRSLLKERSDVLDDMDPISALSLAASIIAVLQFSKEVAGTCIELVETGSLSQHRVKGEAAENLGEYSEITLYALFYLLGYSTDCGGR